LSEPAGSGEDGPRPITVALSSASVYPLSVHDAFAVAQDLAFDGVEVMVTDNATSQNAATAGANSVESIKALGDSLRHVHLSDGSGSGRDEHLVPGRGKQGCAEALQQLAASGFDGVVVAEISTRKARFPGEREEWLAETLGFARRHLSRPLVAAHRL
jgi:hypothetical protein